MITATSFKRYFVSIAAVALAAGSPGGPVWADPFNASETVHLTIDEDTLGASLHAFGKQSGAQILFSETSVSGRAGVRLDGTYTAAAALEALLSGTDLEAVRGQGNTFIIRHRNNQKKEMLKEPDLPRRVSDTPAIASDAEADASSPEPLMVDKIIVTGTSLRGITPESSPLQVYSRDDILGSGVTTTEQFMRTLPQNFGGGSTEFTTQGLPTDGGSQNNGAYATGANLRGLGSGATLTLLNGGRVAPTSTIGDFVDLSMIPVSALERIDVLSDGASSIYGGDAVAGVVNLVLRDDFDGAETALRYGRVTQGDLEEARFSQTLGKTWASGNILGTYEYFDRTSLGLSERPEISAPTLLNGGEIEVVDAFNLLPSQNRNSLVLSGRQAVGDKLQLASTVLYSNRRVKNSSVGISNTSSVAISHISSEGVAASLVADYALSAAWDLTLDGNYSHIHNENRQQIILPMPRVPGEAKTRSSLWSVGLLARGDLFDLPGGKVRAALGGQFRQEDFDLVLVGNSTIRDGARDISAVFAEVLIPLVGETNSLPGINRLELNLSGRIDDYSDFGSTTNPKAGIVWVPIEKLRLRSSYSTSFAPPTLGQSGALDRGVGVLPYDFIRERLQIPLPDPRLDGVNYMITSGTADNLKPETSRSYTAGFDYTALAGDPSLTFSASYYNIKFEDRLGVTPVPGNLNANYAPGFALADPTLFPEGTVIFFPDADQIAAVISSLTRPITFAGGATAVENIGFINNASLTRNLASTETSGIDLQINYQIATDFGQVTASLNSNYIFDFIQRSSDTTPSVQTLNTLYYPVDLRLRGQLGLQRGGFSGSLFVNYVDSYKTDTTQSAGNIGSWTTADLSLTWDFDPATSSWLNGSSIGLAITNLFDTMPPRTPPQSGFSITGYDPANASPLGRFVAFELRKAF